MTKFRVEKDFLGEVKIPSHAHWGASTQRAIDNFPVSGLTFSRDFIRVLALIKATAAETNRELGLLERKLADKIKKVAVAIAEGQYADQFPVDIFQTGSGTSTNMNFNEVAASLSNKLLKSKNSKKPVHPNDHVNKGQSSNDVFPTAIHVTAALLINRHLLPSLKKLEKTLHAKSKAFQKIIKTGRTHLQDAVSLSLGQEFSGYEAQITKSIHRIEIALPALYELAIGGTAIGTGINTHPQFGKKVVEKLSREFRLPFKKATNAFEAIATKDACVQMSGALKTTAVSLTKIANDLRMMASGPNCGLGEINLPELQPGSSIMPGKVNPVQIEMLLQVCAQVLGNDTTVTIAGMGGQFELNAMMPVLAHNLFQSITLLSNAVQLFEEKCVRGIVPNRQKIEATLHKNQMGVTRLVSTIGYDKATEMARSHRKPDLRQEDRYPPAFHSSPQGGRR